MQGRTKENQLNQFQRLLRGFDTIKTTNTGVSFFARHFSTKAIKGTSIYTGLMQITLAFFTLGGMFHRVREDASRWQSNSYGIMVRIGISLLDLSSGILILSDPEAKTERAMYGFSLLTISNAASRLVGEDGHHDTEANNEDQPLLAQPAAGTGKGYNAV